MYARLCPRRYIDKKTNKMVRVHKWHRIAIHYGKAWFVIDAVSVFPFSTTEPRNPRPFDAAEGGRV